MPIRLEDRVRYPRNLPAISLRIRTERAEGWCECTSHSGAVRPGRCAARQGDPHHTVMVRRTRHALAVAGMTPPFDIRGSIEKGGAV